MADLYVKFILTVVMFTILTFVIQFSYFINLLKSRPQKYVYKNASRNNVKVNIYPIAEPGIDSRNSNAGSNRKSLDIWIANTEKDRIIVQMEFIPSTKINENKVIYLHHDFGVEFGNSVFQKENCPVQNCLIVTNTNNQKEIHARMFKEFRVRELGKISRNRDQVWILYMLESPYVTPNFVKLQNNVFNWTASYRIDSTLVTPYEKWKANNTIPRVHNQNYASGKTKKVAIFVSNCNSKNERLTLVHELSLYIDVDVYGQCGHMTCGRNSADECLQMLAKDYKFYLAFENANCRDYITEKFFRNALMSDVLPIVMGAHPDDYRKVAPPNSYIHVEDFESPKELASYLHKLDKNDTLYNEYFKWKGTGSFINTKFWCRLCAMLNDPNKPELIVENMESWWRPKNICLRPGQRWKDLQDS